MSDSESSDYVEKLEQHSQLVTGEVATPDVMVKDFALHGLSKRVEILKALDDSMSGDIDVQDLRKFMVRKDLRDRMGAMHDRLRKAKR